MADAIDKLCEEYDFDKILKQKKTITGMVRLMFRAYEVFYGERSSSPPEVIKKFIRVIIEFSPQAINLRLDTEPNISDKVTERVVEKIYKIAENELLKEKDIEYIS